MSEETIISETQSWNARGYNVDDWIKALIEIRGKYGNLPIGTRYSALHNAHKLGVLPQVVHHEEPKNPEDPEFVGNICVV